jgi:hypothetical protein
MSTVLAVLFAAIMGVFFLLWGYRVFLVMLPIWGFFAGFWLGAAGVTLFLGQGFLATVTGWVIGFILGLIGAVLSYLFYGAFVIIIAAMVGAGLAAAILTALGITTGWIIAIVALVSAAVVAVATLVLNLQKYVIILITSLGGADLIAVAGLLLFGLVTVADLQAGDNLLALVFKESWLMVLIWLTLVVVGFVSQVKANRSFTFERKEYVEAWG